jgi:pyruvoyl-dependent arginine decarboxylase (PvlArgDC)
VAERILRNESTDDGKKLWAAVDAAASRAPGWVREAAGRDKSASKDEEAPAEETENVE